MRSGFNKVMSGVQGINVWLYSWYGIDPEIATRSQNILYATNCAWSQPLLDPDFPQRRRAVRTLCRFLRANDRYYVEAHPASRVAVYHSLDTVQMLHYGVEHEKGAGQMIWADGYQERVFRTYEAVSKRQTPVEAVGSPLSAERLAGLSFLLAPQAQAISGADADILRDWVGAGGCLLAWGDTSRYNEYLDTSDGYWLGDAFGVQRGESALRGALRVESMHAAIGSFSAGQRIPIPARKTAGPVERPALMPIDGAETLMTWADGTAALVLHEYRKGMAILANFDPLDLSAEHRDQLLTDLIHWRCGPVAGAHVAATTDIEINLHKQPGRLLLHLVNYKRSADSTRMNPHGQPYLNVGAAMAVPAGCGVRRLFLIGPDTDGQQDLHYTVTSDDRQDVARFVIPRIDAYGLVVMEIQDASGTVDGSD